jgi:hypothetical protein
MYVVAMRDGGDSGGNAIVMTGGYSVGIAVRESLPR